MNDILLEPYAVSQSWLFPAPAPWESVLSSYLHLLAEKCNQNAGFFLGHIKALALLPDNGYFRVSVIDPLRPPTLEGSIPEGILELELTLNVVVYGVQRQFLEKTCAEIAKQVTRDWQGEVIHRALHHH